MGSGTSKVEPFKLLDARLTVTSPLKYTMYDAVSTSDNTEFSIFAIESDPSEISLTLSSNFVKSWRVYRHPVIAPFIDSYEDEGITYVVTERLMEFDPSVLSENELCWAIHNMSRLVEFLDASQVVHGFLTKGAVFMTPGHELKVAGFQWLSQVENSNGNIQKFRSTWESLLPFAYQGEITTSVDCMFIGMYLKEWEEKLPKIISKFARSWQSSKSKTPITRLLEIEYWETDKFVQYMTFLRELALKDQYDREIFFKNLLENVSNFSKETQTVSILPHLLSALSYSPTPSLLGPILTIGRSLDESKFASIVVPPIVALFENKDRALRIHLLSQIEALVPFLDQRVANEQVFQNIIGGLNDISPQLRQATIIAMAPLAQFLTTSNMAALIRDLKRLQVDQDAQIRTNSVICIAKIADYIRDDNRGQILASAFAKAAVDPYAAARRAAISAFKNCMKYFNNGIIATSVMPAIAPLCVDQMEEIRESALFSMQVFLNVLKGEAPPVPPAKPARTSNQEHPPTKPATLPARNTPSTASIPKKDSENSPEAKPAPKPSRFQKKEPSKPVITKKDDFDENDGWSDDEDFVVDTKPAQKPTTFQKKEDPVPPKQITLKKKTDDIIPETKPAPKPSRFQKKDDTKKEPSKPVIIKKDDDFGENDGWSDDEDFKPVVAQPPRVQKKEPSKPVITKKKDDDFGENDGWSDDEDFKPVVAQPPRVQKKELSKSAIMKKKDDDFKPAPKPSRFQQKKEDKKPVVVKKDDDDFPQDMDGWSDDFDADDSKQQPVPKKDDDGWEDVDWNDDDDGWKDD